MWSTFEEEPVETSAVSKTCTCLSVPPTQLSEPLESHSEAEVARTHAHPNFFIFCFFFCFFLSQIWSPVRRKLQDYFQTRTHKPFGWVAIHLGRETGAVGAIRNSLRFVDDIRQRFLSLEELRPSHISVHSQITGRASALNPPNAFLPKSVCSDFSRGFLLSGNMRFWMGDFCEIEFLFLLD